MKFPNIHIQIGGAHSDSFGNDSKVISLGGVHSDTVESNLEEVMAGAHSHIDPDIKSFEPKAPAPSLLQRVVNYFKIPDEDYGYGRGSHWVPVSLDIDRILSESLDRANENRDSGRGPKGPGNSLEPLRYATAMPNELVVRPARRLAQKGRNLLWKATGQHVFTYLVEPTLDEAVGSLRESRIQSEGKKRRQEAVYEGAYSLRRELEVMTSYDFFSASQIASTVVSFAKFYNETGFAPAGHVAISAARELARKMGSDDKYAQMANKAVSSARRKLKISPSLATLESDFRGGVTDHFAKFRPKMGWYRG